MDTLEEPSRGRTAAQISNAIVGLLHDYTGRGPTKARTHFGANLVSVLLADTMTRAERSLVDAGKYELVLDVRKEFQRTMRNEMVSAVEGLTDRKVIAFMSDNHIDPDLALESFVLEPNGAGPEFVEDETTA
jgi:uncharacterized protein YbcI